MTLSEYNTNTMILMVGIAGAGKTTFAKKTYPAFDRISLDDLAQNYSKKVKLYKRYTPDGLATPSSKSRTAQHVLVSESLKVGRGIVIDDTNLTRHIRSHHIAHGKRYNYMIDCVVFYNRRRALRQNQNRTTEIVPEHVLRNQWRMLEKPRMDEGFASIRYIFS